MKSYTHVLSYVAATPWAIVPEKLSAILGFLTLRAGGTEATADEIAAIAGRPAPGPVMQGAVAVLPLWGTIASRADVLQEASGGTSTERFGRQFKALMADPNVGAVVLDVNSPGGAVSGLRELSAEMLALRGTKRVVAVANHDMCSAAYWLAAAAADEIVASPSSRVGSIGVIAAHEDISKMLADKGVTVTLFTAGKYKGEFSGIEPLTDEAKAFMQSSVDDAYDAFVKTVAKGRGVSVGDVRGGYGEGRALDAKAALAAGLVDRVDTLDAVIAKLAGRSGRVTGGARAEVDAVEIAADEPSPTVAATVVPARVREMGRY